MNRNNWKRLLSLALSAILSTGSCLAASHWAADPALNHVSAAAPPLVGFTSDTLSGDQTITGAQNMGELRNNGKVRYWFGNNAFYGMKRGTPPQGENYDPGSWFLVDTDAIWEDQYMYTRFAVTAPSDGQVNSYMNIHQNSDDYSITADRGHYYQKILTFGVKLWDEIRGGFSEAEKSAMRPAEVTTSAEYRSFEHPFYSFMPRALAATSSENLKDYKIDSAKMIEALEDVSNAETYYGIPYKYADGNGAVDRSNYMRIKDTNTDRLTLENAVCLGASEEKNYQPYDTRSKYSDSVIDVRPSNIYSVTDALLYAPSNLEFEQNKSVGKAIYQNLISVTETLNNSELMGKNIRSKIWTRSFAGVKPDFNHTFVGYSIGENGVVNLKNQIAEPAAFTPALNLDTRRVIMAREKSVDDRQANSGPNLEVVDSSYLDADSVDVGFLLKSDSLHLDSDINGKQLTNVICGGTYQIKYENASASADESSTNNGPLYVAGAIYDDENTMKYYGLLGTVNNDGSGTVSITIPQNLDPSKQYKLAVFEEQRGAAFEQNYPAGRTITAYPTDYASAMNVAAFRPAGITAGIKEKAMLLEDTTYSKADISTMIDVVGNNSGALSATEYRILSKQAYEALPNKTRDEILNADTLDTITTENASATARSQEIVVLYFPTDDQVFSAELSFPVLPQTGAEYSDANSKEWHEIEKNGTTWHYQLNPQGKITALYTKDPVDDLVDDNLVLALPSKLDGLPVIGIGSGESGKPVIPADTDDIFSEIALPANLTSINDYAFFGLKNPAFSVRIPESLEHLGCKAFAKSGIKALRAANLAGDISFRAFAETKKLKHVSIQAAENGISIGKEAFDNAAISTLQLAGTMHLSEHAFRNNTALESVTIPYGGEAEAGTFQGCTGLHKLEWNMKELGNDVFAGCGDISSIVLGSQTEHVAYRWDGALGPESPRTIMVMNPDTIFECYKNQLDNSIRAFGNNGTITVLYDRSRANDHMTVANDLLSVSAYTAEHYGGSDGSYLYNYVQNNGVGAQIVFGDLAVSGDANEDIPANEPMPTGIEATCQEPLLVPAQVNKNKITVRRIFDGAEGDACAPEEFYIIRTSDFNSLAPDITEDAIRELEPCKLEIDDLKHSQTDTVSLTAIVFDERAASGFLSSKLSLPIRGGLEDEEAEEEVSSMLDELVDLFDDTNTEVVRGEFSNETIANIKKAVSDLVDEYQSVQEDYDRILDALYDDEAPDTEDITEVIAHLKELASQSDDMIRMIEDSLDGASIPENASEKLKALLSKVAAVKAQSDAKAESLDTYSDALNEIYKLLELEEDSEEDEDGRIDVSRALDAITALNDTLKSTTSSLDIMAEEKAKLLASNAILENEKLSLASANASLTREKETWANEKSRLKASYETLASEKEDLQAENDILRAGSKDLEALAGENQRLSKANAALTQENTKLAKDKDTLTAANTSLSQAKELAEAALAKEKQNSEAALAKEKKASEAALDKEKKASEAALAEEKKAYEERTASLLSENNKLKAAMDGDTIALVEENQALIKAKKDLEEVNAGLAASNKTLTESGRKLESEKKSLESEYRKLQDTHDTLSSANKELTASNKKLKTANKDLESTRESLTAKMNALTKEKASLTKDRDSLKAENKKLSSSDSELAKLKKENKSIKSENASLQSKLQASRSQSSSLSSLQSENSSLKTRNTELENNNRSLSSDNRSLRNKRDSLRNENDRLSSENRSLRKQVASLQQTASRTGSTSAGSTAASKKKTSKDNVSKTGKKKTAKNSSTKASNKESVKNSSAKTSNKKSAKNSSAKTSNKKSAKGNSAKTSNKKSAKGNSAKTSNKKSAKDNASKTNKKKSSENSKSAKASKKSSAKKQASVESYSGSKTSKTKNSESEESQKQSAKKGGSTRINLNYHSSFERVKVVIPENNAS